MNQSVSDVGAAAAKLQKEKTPELQFREEGRNVRGLVMMDIACMFGFTPMSFVKVQRNLLSRERKLKFPRLLLCQVSSFKWKIGTNLENFSGQELTVDRSRKLPLPASANSAEIQAFPSLTQMVPDGYICGWL